MTAALRRAAAWPPLHALLTRPRVERWVATVNRSTVVHGSAAFVARELSGRRPIARYRLRRLPATVRVRHGTGDVVTLDEVFYTRDYAFTPRASAALAALPAPLRVVDLGANVGYFGAWVLAHHPAARIVAFEPDRVNAALLRQVAADNRPDGTWEVVEAAASNADGTVRFAAGNIALSRALADGEEASGHVEDVRAVDVLPWLAEADLVKIDIEGGEWAILGDPRLAEIAPAALVMEYHPGQCPAPDPHEAARRLLGEAGFGVEPIWRRDDGHGMLWAWKQA